MQNDDQLRPLAASSIRGNPTGSLRAASEELLQIVAGLREMLGSSRSMQATIDLLKAAALQFRYLPKRAQSMTTVFSDSFFQCNE